MKVTEQIEYLLRKGKRPKELLDLGFPKVVITRVRRQLREEKKAQRVKAAKSTSGRKHLTRPSGVSGDDTAATPKRLASLEGNLKSLEHRIGALEAQNAKSVSVDDLNSRLDGTPALGLRHDFKCNCGASGFVALHIQCTKCERETWWGWFPKQ